VRWWTRLRHLGEEWLTREGSQRLRRLSGGAHRCWARGAVGGAGGQDSGHRGVMEELVDGAVAPERTAAGRCLLGVDATTATSDKAASDCAVGTADL
jgi:hypothetical protein